MNRQCRGPDFAMYPWWTLHAIRMMPRPGKHAQALTGDRKASRSISVAEVEVARQAPRFSTRGVHWPQASFGLMLHTDALARCFTLDQHRSPERSRLTAAATNRHCGAPGLATGGNRSRGRRPSTGLAGSSIGDLTACSLHEL
jgi:hypothetical protein